MPASPGIFLYLFLFLFLGSISFFMGRALAIFFSIFLLLLIVGYQVYSSIQLNDGKWVYPLDDTYIHMSMGKNLAEHGQWGITRHEFSSSSSSILYTLLIAFCFKIAGAKEYIPLVLNIFFGVTLYLALWQVSIKERIRPLALFIVCIFVLFFTPLPALVISGMEHTLQILVDILFIYLVSKALESKAAEKKYLWVLLAFASLSVMIRFEGIFIVGIASGLFLVKKEVKTSLLVFLFGALPVLIFGIYSLKHGAYFIPNSLLMKGEKPSMNFFGLVRFAFGWLDKLKHNPHLLTLFLALCAYIIYLKNKKVSFWNRTSTFATMLVFTFIIHLTLAKTGWFFRYEAYLVFSSLFVFMWVINDQLRFFILRIGSVRLYLAFVLLLMTGMYPLYARGKDALLATVPATKNIYEQQYQMAAFLKKYYNNASVGANDIGAICFFTNIRLFDIFGLGSKEIVDLRIKKQYDKEHIYALSLEKKTDIVVIYEDWFIGKVPEHWKKAGAWKISDNVILGGEIVSFFATGRYDPSTLKKHLDEFSENLPEGVEELQ
jgi:hypothetical protein